MPTFILQIRLLLCCLVCGAIDFPVVGYSQEWEFADSTEVRKIDSPYVVQSTGTEMVWLSDAKGGFWLSKHPIGLPEWIKLMEEGTESGIATDDKKPGNSWYLESVQEEDGTRSDLLFFEPTKSAHLFTTRLNLAEINAKRLPKGWIYAPWTNLEKLAAQRAGLIPKDVFGPTREELEEYIAPNKERGFHVVLRKTPGDLDVESVLDSKTPKKSDLFALTNMLLQGFSKMSPERKFYRLTKTLDIMDIIEQSRISPTDFNQVRVTILKKLLEGNVEWKREPLENRIMFLAIKSKSGALKDLKILVDTLETAGKFGGMAKANGSNIAKGQMRGLMQSHLATEKLNLRAASKENDKEIRDLLSRLSVVGGEEYSYWNYLISITGKRFPLKVIEFSPSKLALNPPKGQVVVVGLMEYSHMTVFNYLPMFHHWKEKYASHGFDAMVCFYREYDESEFGPLKPSPPNAVIVGSVELPPDFTAVPKHTLLMLDRKGIVRRATILDPFEELDEEIMEHVERLLKE